MSDVLYYSTTASLLLGILLVFSFGYKHYDEIVQTINDSVQWTVDNVLSILFVLFVISLGVTALASVGLV